MRFLFQFSGVALVLLGFNFAGAFTLVSTNPAFKGWRSGDIQFQLNLNSCPNGVDVRGLINDAFAIWNNVASSKMKLMISGDTTSTALSDPITIFCDTNYGTNFPGAEDSSPGIATSSPGNGEYINTAVIHLNASSGDANIANLSRDLVVVVLAHEIGHAIGLGHSQDVNALMYYDASLKQTFSLAQDDVDGVNYLYPRNELGKDPMMGGCGSVSSLKTPVPPHPLVLLLLGIFPIAVGFSLRSLSSARS